MRGNLVRVRFRLFSTMVTAVLVLVSLNLVVSHVQSETRQDITLKVAIKTDIATTNILAGSDIWTQGVLFPVYMTVGMLSPDFAENYPYILKGVDADDSGMLDSDEYGVFNKDEGLNQRSVTAYYDLNGVYFHDGVQATKEDLLFGYHAEALMGAGDIFGNSLDILMDKSNLDGSNYSSERWLWVYHVDDAWDANVPVGGNSSLTFALHFELQSNYYAFVDYTLHSLRLYPQYLWEGTGKHCLVAQNGICSEWEGDIHEDFGQAYDPVAGNGIPVTSADAFNVSAVQSWVPEVKHVIGTGPFEFVEWSEGYSVRLDRYEDFFVDAVDRKGTPYLRKPYAETILYKIYKTAQAAVFALQAGEIDVVSWSVPPEFVSSLQQDPNVGIRATAGKGFTYLGYNMCGSPWGYPDNDPSAGDDGYWLRKAVAHVIDKKTIVTTLLQNFGVAGDQPVSPASVKWYNSSVTRYDYDLDAARQILDDHYTIGGFGLGWSGGWRVLPTIGNSEIEILCPQADYDPRRARVCEMIAGDMVKIGLNAKANLVAFGEIVEKLNNRDMQMWVLDWRIGSNPQDYYYPFFYSGKSEAGLNYPGFQNETFDQLVLQARSEFNVSEQRRLIKEASGLLADALPIDVLYFMTNTEPFVSDRFINYTASLIGFNVRESFWTLISIHPPFVKDIIVSISAPSAVETGSAVMVLILARDYCGVLPDVKVDVCVNPLTFWRDPGNITLGDKRDKCVSGMTDESGKIVALYEAPDIGELEEMRVSITAEATSEYRKSNTAWTHVTVFPKEKKFLSVLMRMDAGDVVAMGYALPLRVEVTDQKGMRLDGVKVNLTSFPEGLTLRPSTGTTVGGFIESVVEPPSTIESGFDHIRFNIIASAELVDYEPTTGIRQIFVIESSPASDSPPSDSVYSQISLLLIAVLVFSVVVLALIRLRKSRKQ